MNQQHVQALVRHLQDWKFICLQDSPYTLEEVAAACEIFAQICRREHSASNGKV
ncbi:MAG TPA: hypothetical protein V6D33_05840 [Cyanophyceae cyanobacterium]